MLDPGGLGDRGSLRPREGCLTTGAMFETTRDVKESRYLVKIGKRLAVGWISFVHNLAVRETIPSQGNAIKTEKAGGRWSAVLAFSNQSFLPFRNRRFSRAFPPQLLQTRQSPIR